MSAEDYKELKDEAITGPNQIVATLISEHEYIFGSTVMVPYDGSQSSPPNLINSRLNLTGPKKSDSQESTDSEENLVRVSRQKGSAFQSPLDSHGNRRRTLSTDHSLNTSKSGPQLQRSKNKIDVASNEDLHIHEDDHGNQRNVLLLSSSKRTVRGAGSSGNYATNRNSHILVKSSSDEPPSTSSSSMNEPHLISLAKKEFFSTSLGSSGMKKTSLDSSLSGSKNRLMIPMLTLNNNPDELLSSIPINDSKFARKRKVKNLRGKSLDSGSYFSVTSHHPSSALIKTPLSNTPRSVSEERRSPNDSRSVSTSGSVGSCGSNEQMIASLTLRPSSASSGLMVVNNDNIRRCKSSEEMIGSNKDCDEVQKGPRSYSLRPAEEVEEFRSLLTASGGGHDAGSSSREFETSPSSEPTEAKRRLSSESKSTNTSGVDSSPALLNMMRSNDSFLTATTSTYDDGSLVTSQDSLLTVGSSVESASLTVMNPKDPSVNNDNNNARRIRAQSDMNDIFLEAKEYDDQGSRDEHLEDEKQENLDNQRRKSSSEDMMIMSGVRSDAAAAALDELSRGENSSSAADDYSSDTEPKTTVREVIVPSDNSGPPLDQKIQHAMNESIDRSISWDSCDGGSESPMTAAAGVVVLRPQAIDKTKRMNAIRRCSAITRIDSHEENENAAHDAKQRDANDPHYDGQKNKEKRDEDKMMRRREEENNNNLMTAEEYGERLDHFDIRSESGSDRIKDFECTTHTERDQRRQNSRDSKKTTTTASSPDEEKNHDKKGYTSLERKVSTIQSSFGIKSLSIIEDDDDDDDDIRREEVSGSGERSLDDECDDGQQQKITSSGPSWSKSSKDQKKDDEEAREKEDAQRNQDREKKKNDQCTDGHGCNTPEGEDDGEKKWQDVCIKSSSTCEDLGKPFGIPKMNDPTHDCIKRCQNQMSESQIESGRDGSRRRRRSPEGSSGYSAEEIWTIHF